MHFSCFLVFNHPAMDINTDNIHKSRHLTKCIFFVVFAVCIFPACLFAFRRPYYNWDMLPYMAIVLKLDQPQLSIKNIHAKTYHIAGLQVPDPEYGYLVQSPYREKMVKDAAAFYGQLPFYTVKPLYIGMIYLLYKAGFSLTKSTVLPSIIAYFLMGLLLLYWLRKYIKPPFSFPGSLLIMYTPFMINTARLSTPDAVSSLIFLGSFYFIIEKPSIIPLFVLLLLSVFARLDNIVTCLIMLSFLFFIRKWQKRISLLQYGIMAGALVLCYFVVTWFTVRPFGENITYYPDFANTLNLAYQPHGGFSFKDYVALAYSYVITVVVYQHFTFFAFLAFLVIIPAFINGYKIRFEQWFILLLIFIILTRFILFPNLEDRFYISFYLCILILLVKQYTETDVFSNTNLSSLKVKS